MAQSFSQRWRRRLRWHQRIARWKRRVRRLRYTVMRLCGLYPARGGGLTKRELERRLLSLEARHPGFVSDLLGVGASKGK